MEDKKLRDYYNGLLAQMSGLEELIQKMKHLWETLNKEASRVEAQLREQKWK